MSRKSKETIETERLILESIKMEQLMNDVNAIAPSSGQHIYGKLKSIVTGNELN